MTGGRLLIVLKLGPLSDVKRSPPNLSSPPTMDIIHQCLSLAPVPYLSAAFSALRLIWSSVQQVQASKGQLEALAQSIAQLLQTLDDEYRAGRLLQVKTSVPLADLCRFVV